MKILGIRANVAQSSYHNERWEEHIAMFEFWARCMNQAYGLDCYFNYALDFDKNFDLESSVFLSKLMTEVQRYDVDGLPLADGDDPQRYESVIAKFDIGTKLSYDPKTGFQTSKPQLSCMNADVKIANRALIEQAKAAFILVQATKAARLEEINLDYIADPVQKFTVQQVSPMVGVNVTGEPVDMESLPVNESLVKESSAENRKIVLGQELMGAINALVSDIHMGVVQETKQKPQAKTFNLGDMLKASQGPAPL